MSKKSKNILLINHYAGSPMYGMEFRPYYLAREWVKQGHEVTIVASSESHVRYQKPTIHGDVTLQMLDGIKYYWLKTTKYQSNGLKRAINMFSFVRQLYRQRKHYETEKPFDVVIASSTHPLDIYPAYKIAKAHNAKLVFEVHDLWPLSPMEISGMSAWHPFIMLIQHAENYACKHSDKVISLLPHADTHLVKHGMNQKKYANVPNGIVLEDWNPDVGMVPDEHQNLICQLKSEGKTIVGYLGGHGPANALEDLIQAAEILRNKPIAFVFVGQGSDKEKLIDQAMDLGLINVHFLPPVPKPVVSGLLTLMDVLYSGRHKKPLFRFGISPNKLLDYMLSEKPIVHAVASPNDIVADANCGISVPAQDCEAIAEAIDKLCSLSESRREEIGLRGAEHVKEHYQFSHLAEQFLEYVDEEHLEAAKIINKEDAQKEIESSDSETASEISDLESIGKIAS